MEVRSVEFLREVESSDADSKAVRAVCGWAAEEIERLRQALLDAAELSEYMDPTHVYNHCKQAAEAASEERND